MHRLYPNLAKTINMHTFALVCVSIGKARYGSSFTANDAMKVGSLQVLATSFHRVALATSLDKYLLSFLCITGRYAHCLDTLQLRCTSHGEFSHQQFSDNKTNRLTFHSIYPPPTAIFGSSVIAGHGLPPLLPGSECG